jgi:2-polyprenyl-3-methyl-5-hydroxy-6-metoxy-1,4-benzoquinol methylase
MCDEVVEETVKMAERRCRFCQTPLAVTFADLGVSPLANSYLQASDLQKFELFYPLHAYVCPTCFLVQIEEISSPLEIFSDYLYFSSYSESWLQHAAGFAREAISNYNLNSSSRVVEIGSNDGYLLRFFMEAGVSVLGIEPAENVAAVAQSKGIETVSRFFGSALAGELAAQGRQADLLVGNNVIAHIPDLNDLMRGLRILLKPDGVISLEFPHLLSLMEQNQFDTIYHEHYSYFSLTTIMRVFEAHKLKVFDAELLQTHGGSLRVYACHGRNEKRVFNRRVEEICQLEKIKGLTDLATYEAFSEQVKAVKRSILKFMVELKDQGSTIAGYGAPAKGNTLLNYCGIGPDFIDFTVDRSPHKQGLFLPGSRIPVYGPEYIDKARPDYLLILPWNLKDEITRQMEGIRKWGGQFITLIPEIEIF